MTASIAQEWWSWDTGRNADEQRHLLCDDSFASTQLALSLVLQHLHRRAARVALPLQGAVLLLALPPAPQALLKVRRYGLRAISGINKADLATVCQQQHKGTVIKESIHTLASTQCMQRQHPSFGLPA